MKKYLSLSTLVLIQAVSFTAAMTPIPYGKNQTDLTYFQEVLALFKGLYLPVFIAFSQVIFFIYLSSLLYRMYVSKTVVKTGAKKWAVSVFATLYVLTIFSWVVLLVVQFLF
jgi:hypothetical protein